MSDPYALIDPPTPIFKKVGAVVRTQAEEGSRLRDVQKDALHNLEGWFTNPETTRRTALVVMPTGTGKSGVMCCLPYYLASTKVPIEGLDFSKPVLFIAPDLTINEQLTNDLSIPKTKVSPKPFLVRSGIISDNAQTLHATMPVVNQVASASELCEYLQAHCGVVVTNAQKWHIRPTAVWETLQEDCFSLVIVDEAHHLPADQWKRVVEKFKCHARVVFFTATPYRADGKSICDEVGEHRFAYYLSRNDAIKRNIIRLTKFCEIAVTKESPFETLLHHTVNRLEEKDKKSPLPDDKQHVAMIIMGNVQEVNDMTILAKMKHPQLHTVAVCKKQTQLHATQIRRELPIRERKKAMKDIKDGTARIIIIVKMLLEGFDHPPVSIAAICTSIHSPVRFAQFIGRAQRVIPGEEDVVADVITLDVFNQQTNFDKFEKEWFIPKTEAEVEAQ